MEGLAAGMISAGPAAVILAFALAVLGIATDGGHPKVCRAGVEHDHEGLWGCAEGDFPIIRHVKVVAQWHPDKVIR